jgi:hypothetical protein
MSEDAERRQHRQFEPPPWEREKFEALAQQREAEQRAIAAAIEAATPERPAEEAARPASEPASAAALAGAREAGPEPVPKIDERKVNAMLIELSGQEGSARAPISKAGRVIGILFGAVGSGVTVFGAALAGRSTAADGRVGSAVIAFLGVFMTGAAIWMWVRAGNEQGS